MKISQNMEKAMNAQLKDEFDSAFLYLSMSAWFQSHNLAGFAHWCELQFHEEQEHAMKFYNYITSRQGDVSIVGVNKPANAWNTPLEVFEAILAQEIKVTDLINKLYSTAKNEDDFASMSFLNYFLDEQIEEEENASNIVNQLKLIGDSNTGLMFLDAKLAERKD